MARPTKQGIDFFPMDVQFDEKMELFLSKEGADGLGIIVTIFQLIYQNHGYYVENGQNLYLLVRRRILSEVGRIEAVVSSAIEFGIFNKTVYKKYKILTSRGIQERYFLAASRKKIVSYNINYIINGVNVSNNSVNVSKNATKEEEEEKEKGDTANNINPDHLDISLRYHKRRIKQGVKLPSFRSGLTDKSKVVIDGAEEIRKLVELDGENLQEIEKTLGYILGMRDEGNAFWSDKVLTLGSIRSNWKNGMSPYYSAKMEIERR